MKDDVQSEAGQAQRTRSVNATVAEAAQHCGISRSTLYELMYSGHITPIRFGRAVRFAWADVERLASTGTGSR